MAKNVRSGVDQNCLWRRVFATCSVILVTRKQKGGAPKRRVVVAAVGAVTMGGGILKILATASWILPTVSTACSLYEAFHKYIKIFGAGTKFQSVI